MPTQNGLPTHWVVVRSHRRPSPVALTHSTLMICGEAIQQRQVNCAMYNRLKKVTQKLNHKCRSGHRLLEYTAADTLNGREWGTNIISVRKQWIGRRRQPHKLSHSFIHKNKRLKRRKKCAPSIFELVKFLMSVDHWIRLPWFHLGWISSFFVLFLGFIQIYYRSIATYGPRMGIRL